MSETGHRSCKCEAVYRRTESMAKAREINSFQCEVCGETLESWNTAWVRTYRLIAGPGQSARMNGAYERNDP